MHWVRACRSWQAENFHEQIKQVALSTSRRLTHRVHWPKPRYSQNAYRQQAGMFLFGSRTFSRGCQANSGQGKDTPIKTTKRVHAPVIAGQRWHGQDSWKSAESGNHQLNLMCVVAFARLFSSIIWELHCKLPCIDREPTAFRRNGMA